MMLNFVSRIFFTVILYNIHGICLTTRFYSSRSNVCIRRIITCGALLLCDKCG